MWNFKTETVYLGRSMQRLAEVKSLLRGNGIAFRTRVSSRQGGLFYPGSGSVRGRLGSAGTDAALAYEYEVKVSAKDAPAALHLIGRGD